MRSNAKILPKKATRTAVLTVALLLSLLPSTARAAIDGLTSPDGSFQLTAKADFIITPDNNSIYMWGYANGSGRMQYPGPTLIVNEGDTVSVQLTNLLPMPVSIVFPGQQGVTATGGSPGLLTREAASGGGTVSYSFVASRPGTYLYHSGTRPDLQIEMGLVGALIVRPALGANFAYNRPDTAFDDEFLFLLSEVDPNVHKLASRGRLSRIDTTAWFPVYWFINGRCAPDTMMAPYPEAPQFPTQPYNCMPMMMPGQKLLMRVIGAGRDLHPFHHHGNHARVIAADGRPLEGPLGEDLSHWVFTIQSVPGQTVDAIFEWTGQNMGWDIYGHEQDIDNAPAGNFPGPEDIDHNQDGIFDSVPMEMHEYEADHGKPFPVVLPEKQFLTFGGMYSGSPFLGVMGSLPPGQGGLNPEAGYAYMWHSHAEKEMTNWDIFPGGMMTMLMIVPHTMPMP